MATPRGGRGGSDRRNARGGYTTNNYRGRGRNNNGAAAQSDDERPNAHAYGGRSGGNNRSHSRGQSSNANASTSASNSASPPPTFAPKEYQKRLAYMRAQRPKLRAQFIKDGLMNPDGQMRLRDSVKMYGLCHEMCPEYERVRRIVELDVKAPECTPETQHLPSRSQRVPDESRMVKAYARSAAGMDVELVSEIRSPAGCLKTIEYLYDRLDHDDFVFLYSWLWDRTRAVRKDLRTQRIEKEPYVGILLKCLERSARFYMLASHHMARSNKDDYSHQQDVEQLNQTLISLKERYADNRRDNIISENEAEFWAYRLLLAPIYANTQLENELHRLPSDLRNNPRVQTALEIFRVLKSLIIHNYNTFHQCQSNWKKFWDLMKSPRVSYLMACAAAISFNRVRHVVLDAAWRAYRVGPFRRQIKVRDWTPAKLKEVLGMDSEPEAVKFCEAHGFVFDLDEQGQTFMDIRQKDYEVKARVLPKADIKPQFFSASIVEAKRCGRPLSAVIKGLTVQEAKRGEQSGNGASGMQTEDQTSLFVPETSKVFGQKPNGTTTVASGFNFKPTASPFQANGLPTTSESPFAKGSQPGVFDASKNPILFAPSTTTPNANPFLQRKSSTPPATPINPFLKNSTAAPALSTRPTTPNPFTNSTFAAPPSVSFPEQPAAIASKPATGFGFGISQPGMSFTPSGTPPQADASPQESEKQKAEREKREAAEKQQREAAEKQQREDEARKRVQEAQRAKQAQEEERRRQAEEQRQKQAEAKAAQLRQRQQEQADRERRAREEQEQLVRQAKQRQALEDEARAARIRKKDSALHALTEHVMFDAREGLFMQFIDHAAGNLAREAQKAVEMERRVAYADRKYEQYLVGLKRAALAKMLLVAEKQRKDRKVREWRKRVKEQRARAAEMEEEDMVDAPAPAESTKAEAPATTMAQAPATTKAEAPATTQPTVNPAPQRPAAPPNARRVQRTQERHQAQVSNTNGVTLNRTISSTSAPIAAHSTVEGSLHTSLRNTTPPIAAYSQSYQQAVAHAPVDRTETDWFRLRARGIDPSKYRKRSFGSSSSDEEKPKLIEPKRPKLSPPAAETQNPPKTPTVLDEQRARFTAIQQAFKRSVSRSPSVSGATSVNGQSSFNGATSAYGHSSYNDSSLAVIEKARKVLGKSKTDMPPPSYTNGARSMNRSESFDGNTSLLIARANGLVSRNDTASLVQHDWGRSVPNLNLSASQGHQTTYGTNFGTTSTKKDRPAYWDRISRFVPYHLYGKGPEAILAWRREQGLSQSPASTRPATVEPLAMSSPIPTQQSYMPPPQSHSQGYTQEQYSSISGSDADDTAVMTDDEEIYHAQPKPYHSGQYSQRESSEDEDADSEMVDGEDDDEDDEEEEGGYVSGQYYNQPASGEEDPQSYEEDTEDEEDKEEEEQKDMPNPKPKPQTQTQTNNNGNDKEKPGATEDDAIELSD
ncbi:hypothetical protein BDW02DRAFT_565578 [Decorospora gaudefroyi]|uniref:SAC3/GANP/THP3 conserved domain-containing protein n=1 Tax=Decorospora gaudefroyi TaxID=184978 RepID=A0A6A5KTN9_9PLEO|nr:hypothetical protein BDW02DRAFT_565578 [Decorospora gaudefroyi]